MILTCAFTCILLFVFCDFMYRAIYLGAFRGSRPLRTKLAKAVSAFDGSGAPLSVSTVVESVG